MLFLDKLLVQYLFKHFLDKHLVGLEWRLRKPPAHPSAEELVGLAFSRKRMSQHGLATVAWLSPCLTTLRG